MKFFNSKLASVVMTGLIITGCNSSDNNSGNNPGDSNELRTVTIGFDIGMDTSPMMDRGFGEYLDTDNYIIKVNGEVNENIPAFSIDSSEPISIEVRNGYTLTVEHANHEEHLSAPVTLDYSIEGDHTIIDGETDIVMALENKHYNFVTLADSSHINGSALNNESSDEMTGEWYFHGFVNGENYDIDVFSTNVDISKNIDVVVNQHHHWYANNDGSSIDYSDDWDMNDTPIWDDAIVPLDQVIGADKKVINRDGSISAIVNGGFLGDAPAVIFDRVIGTGLLGQYTIDFDITLENSSKYFMNIYLENDLKLTLQFNGTAFDSTGTTFGSYEEALYTHRNEVVTQTFVLGPFYGKGNFMLRTSGSESVDVDEAFTLNTFNIKFDETITPEPPEAVEEKWVADRMKNATVIDNEGELTTYLLTGADAYLAYNVPSSNTLADVDLIMNADTLGENGYTNLYLTDGEVNYCVIHMNKGQNTRLRTDSCANGDQQHFDGTWDQFVSNYAELEFRGDYFEFPLLMSNVIMRVQNAETSIDETLTTEFGYTVK